MTFYTCEFAHLVSKETQAWTLVRQLEVFCCQHGLPPWYIKGKLDSPCKALSPRVPTDSFYSWDTATAIIWGSNKLIIQFGFILLFQLFSVCLMLDLPGVHFHICWRKASVLFTSVLFHFAGVCKSKTHTI